MNFSLKWSKSSTPPASTSLKILHTSPLGKTKGRWGVNICVLRREDWLGAQWAREGDNVKIVALGLVTLDPGHVTYCLYSLSGEEREDHHHHQHLHLHQHWILRHLHEIITIYYSIQLNYLYNFVIIGGQSDCILLGSKLNMKIILHPASKNEILNLMMRLFPVFSWRW